MKIGIDGRAANWYRGTGIGTYTYQLINSLNLMDKENDFLLFSPTDCHFPGGLNNNFTIRNINANTQGNFWDEVNIPNILQDNEVEIYHVPQNGVGLPTEKKCPFVITLHDVIPYRMPETVGDRYLSIFNNEIPRLIKLCDGIITVSDFSKQDIMKVFNFPEDKIFVTPLASEDYYHPMNKPESKELLKRKYGICDDYILYVGGFSPRKNIVGLIESFSKLLPSYDKEIKLVIAGKQGKSFSIYKKRAEELHIEDKVLFPGFIEFEDMPYLYSAARLFVYPSFYEGFGLPPLEAMSCGTPVIASNTTSIPEVLGDSALLVNPHDIDTLCNHMLRALSDNKLRQKLIIKGFIKTQQLTWNNTAKQTLSAYKNIVN